MNAIVTVNAELILTAGSVADPDPDPDDNAGDADTAGDGSACMEGRFIDYNDYEGLDGTSEETTFEAVRSSKTTTFETGQSSKTKTTVLGMPMDELVRPPSFLLLIRLNLLQDGVLRDARHAIQHFRYTNPFDPPERGIMTYSRARLIVQEWHTLGLKYLNPYLNRYRLHGTTILRRNIDITRYFP